MAEPGRYLVSAAQTLVVQVIGKKIREGRQFLFVNDGIYRSFSNVIYDNSKLLDEPIGKPTTIGGNTCDGLDRINCFLPEIQLFDWLAIGNMGAYTNGSASTFNSFPKNKFVIVN
jgi:ornithine decarboxylase